MTNFHIILLLIGLTVAGVAVNAVDVRPQNFTISTPNPTTQLPPEPTSKPTEPTPKPTEPTAKPTEPTTAAPTKPPTTAAPTKPPTTAAPTKPPTTAAPTKPTTTTEPPKPPKPIDPQTGVWQVNDASKNATACLLVKFALQIQIPYHYKTNNVTELAFLDIPKTAVGSGICGNETENITLEWKQNDADKFNQSVKLSFSKNSTTHKYYLQEIYVKVVPDNSTFPGIIDVEKNKTIELAYKQQEFVTSLSKSYKCDKNQILNLTDVVDNKQKGEIHISHIQFQAFEESKNKEFTKAEDCEPSDTPDIVPIAVGCILALLVIVVLVAYLIGRRRRQARGYLSMFAGTKRESDYIPMKHLSCFQ